MSTFLAWWEHFGSELDVTPKQLAQAAYEAAKLDTDLQGEWGDGYAEGYRHGVADQKALQGQQHVD